MFVCRLPRCGAQLRRLPLQPLLQHHITRPFPVWLLHLPSLHPSTGTQGLHLWVREPVCGLFKGMSVISVSFHLTQMGRIPTLIFSQIFGELLSPGLRPWTWEPPNRARTFLLQGGLCNHILPPGAALPYAGMGPALFVSLPLLLVSIWLLFYIIRYVCYYQLDFM